MLERKLGLAFPIAMIALGVGALLTTLGITPQIDWIWTLGILVAAIMPIIIVGLDKVTFVIGALLLIVFSLSILRQLAFLQFAVEVPILIIALGILMLIARMPVIPSPKWVEGSQSKAE